MYPRTIAFCLPPVMETQIRRVMKEDDLSVREQFRQAIRLFMEGRKLRRRERIGWMHSNLSFDRVKSVKGTDD